LKIIDKNNVQTICHFFKNYIIIKKKSYEKCLKFLSNCCMGWPEIFRCTKALIKDEAPTNHLSDEIDRILAEGEQGIDYEELPREYLV